MSDSRRGPWTAAMALLALGIAMVWLGGEPVVNNALSVWFVEDDPARVAYESFREDFGNDEVVILAVGTPGASMGGPTLDRVELVAERMRDVEGIESVMTPRSGALGPLRDLLRSDDGTVVLVSARLEVMDDVDSRRHDILVGLRQAASALVDSGVETHWAGIGLVYDELNEASFKETPLLTGASFVIVGLVLYAVVGSVLPVVVALAGVVVAIMIVMGAFSLLGFELNMVTAVLPTLILVVGTANAVHIFTRLRRARGGELDMALREVFKPCLFTALTTAAGFASLATARMAVIRDLGIFASLGVLVVLVTSFVFIRAALSRPRFRIRDAGSARTARVLSRLSDLVVGRPKSVLAVSGLLTGIALWSAGSVVVDTYSIEFFREGHPVRVDSDAIEAGYGWYLPLELGVVAPVPESATQRPLVDAVAAWQADVEARGLAQWSLSLADFVSAPPPSAGPASGVASTPVGQGTVADARRRPGPALDPVDAGLTDADESTLRVTFGVPMASARQWSDRIAEIRQAAEGVLPPDARLTAGGYLPLYVRMMDYIVDTQVRSFATALVLVFLVMAVFLRSIRTVSLAFLPNLLPIVFIFGIMGALGIRLDIATVTVAAVALGIVVDDTVHFLHRYREAMERTDDPEAAVRSAILEVGPALVGTTVILAASFAVLGLASVLSIALFGLLCAATLVLALIADLLVLPAMLLVFQGRGRPLADPGASS